MNKIVIGISLVVGLYLVSFATAGDHLGNVPVTADDSVPHHAPLTAPLTAPVVPMGTPLEGTINCDASDAHRTDVPLNAPMGAPLLDAAAQTDVPLNAPTTAPLTGTFPCQVPANS